MKLVKFDDGMFGIRFGLIYPYRYLDLNDPQYQWVSCTSSAAVYYRL